MTDRKIRVLHFSSRHEDCGVARYLGHHIKGMEEVPHIENDYFDVSPYETHNMSESNLTTMADDLYKKLKGYDVLHIQLEFALYGHDSFRRIVEAGKRSHRKIIISVHCTAPALSLDPRESARAALLYTYANCAITGTFCITTWNRLRWPTLYWRTTAQQSTVSSAWA